MGICCPVHHDDYVLSLSRACPFPEWLLLELPNGEWAAFWCQGIGGSRSTAIWEGNFDDACSFRHEDKFAVLRHMEQHLMKR